MNAKTKETCEKLEILRRQSRRKPVDELLLPNHTEITKSSQKNV